MFDQAATQLSVYQSCEETVADVLRGYNGTIFAYGPTGSGKTYTMFGNNIFDDELKGVIPRAAVDIFRKWEASDNVKEMWVCCSMLEIYKENLHDLLADCATELKIKESPSRGIYVEGLCEIPIASVEELMYYIDLGGTRRAWAETRHNHVSSRSHSIFMLEVRQVLSNDTETRGILNLVDLAGCEKVGKSGAQGQIFEEGTKINLSLSALGNVIHALVSGVEHVPYRDSKLTRLLQESLGGNYKTSLIVTCSPHSSQLPETLTTLKFAQRAKKLQNRVKMNIKNSPEQLLKMVEKLKLEVRRKDVIIAELRRKGGKGGEIDSAESRADEEFGEGEIEGDSSVGIKRSKSAEKFRRKRTETDKSLAGAEQDVLPAHSSINTSKMLDVDNESSERRLREREQENDSLKEKAKELSAQIEALERDKLELEQKLKASQMSLVEERRRAVDAERKLAELEDNKRQVELVEEKPRVLEVAENTQASVMGSQIRALTDALEDAEAECLKLMKDKKDRVEKDSTELCTLKALEEFIGKATDPVRNIIGDCA